MIHSSITHPNVVAFEDAIEDDEHVYFKLELCKAGVSRRESDEGVDASLF